MDNELKHYGVKGMRWGVRKDRSSSSKGKKKKKSSVGKKISRHINKKRAKREKENENLRRYFNEDQVRGINRARTVSKVASAAATGVAVAYGSKAYVKARKMGYSRAKSFTGSLGVGIMGAGEHVRRGQRVARQILFGF